MKAGYTLEWLQVNQIGMWEEVSGRHSENTQILGQHGGHVSAVSASSFPIFPTLNEMNVVGQ